MPIAYHVYCVLQFEVRQLVADAPQGSASYPYFWWKIFKHQKERRRLAVFRLGALTGSLLTLVIL